MKTVLKYAAITAAAGALALAMSTSGDAKTVKRVHHTWHRGAVAAGIAVGAGAAALAAGGYYYGPGGYYGGYYGRPWRDSYAYAPGPYPYASGAYAYAPGPYAYASDAYAYAPGPYAASYADEPSDMGGYGAYAYSPAFYANAGGMSCVTEGTYGKGLDYAGC